MKLLAMAVNEKNMNAKLSDNLARAKYFAFVNLDDGNVEFKENPAFTSSGGAGIKAGQFLLDNQVEILITKQLGQNASDLLAGAVKMFTGIDSSLDENLAKYKNGELEQGTSTHPGFHHG